MFCLGYPPHLAQIGIFSPMPDSRKLPSIVAISTGLTFILTACGQPSMEKTLERYNKGTVAYISAETLITNEDLVLLDTRRKEEFEVSHLARAEWVGYKAFDLDQIKREFPNKKTPFVVYCSVGVRSENIGEKLLEAGYTDVKNLYGGIFEWKNQGYPVYTTEGVATEKVHAYNRRWGRLLKNAEKIY